MNLSSIVPNQKINFILKKGKDSKNIEIVKINYPLSKTTFVQIDKKKEKIEIKKNITELFKKDIIVGGKISNSLYSSAVKAGIEPNIIIEFARIFGFEVDFQRDIRKGDVFEIIFERYSDDRKKTIKTGKILYAYLNVNNQGIKLYRFNKKGSVGFYDDQGKSIVKALMKTPINGARLSSSYGKRKHPILGYTNRRVIVFDAESGEYLRHWGAYGNPPDDTPVGRYDPEAPPEGQFRGPVHGIVLSRDGLVYVTDRGANRAQVFTRAGEFVREGFIAPETRDLGTAYGVALSHDAAQRWVYINDGSNNTIWILRRDTLETVGRFGSYGRGGGQLLSAHSMAVDQQGNVYIGETRGRRVQRFRLVGAQ